MREIVERCLTGVETAGPGILARFIFPRCLEVFDGHFPGIPLVPAVFLVEAARAACERLASARLRIVSIDDARFTAQVGPDEPIEVRATLEADGNEWICRAEIRSATGSAARLRLRLALD